MKSTSQNKRGSMLWQSKGHHGAATLDSPMAEQVASFLENKESVMGSRIVSSINLFQDFPPLLDHSISSFLRINDALDIFGKKIHSAGQAHRNVMPAGTWESTTKEVNQALWQYVEVIEECVNELFQQIDQIGFEHLNEQVVHSAEVIRDNLSHRIDDVLWAIRRLDEQLKEYKKICVAKSGGWDKWKGQTMFWSRAIDGALEPDLKKCKKYLNVRFQKFMDKYLGLIELRENTTNSIEKFNNFTVFRTLESESREKFLKLYSLLEVWNLNTASKTLNAEEPLRALRLAGTPESYFSLFQEYYRAIRKGLFEASRKIKTDFPMLYLEDNYRRDLLNQVEGYREELDVLAKTAENYNNFMNKLNHKSEYSIMQWFSKSKTKSVPILSKTIQEIDDLDYYCEEFLESVQKEPVLDTPVNIELENEVDMYLHEMGQPLISKDMMRKRVESLVNDLEGLDELGTCHGDVVEYVQEVLCRAMRLDWKYHVLQDIPAFHRLIDVHHQLALPRGNTQHTMRLQKLRHVLDQLNHFISQGDVVKKLKEIEFDINDIKAYLQDFFASIQRLDQSGTKEDVFQSREALIEYLYLLGKFFHGLDMENPEHRYIRKQMYFVDQYFDAIAAFLNNLPSRQ